MKQIDVLLPRMHPVTAHRCPPPRNSQEVTPLARHRTMHAPVEAPSMYVGPFHVAPHRRLSLSSTQGLVLLRHGSQRSLPVVEQRQRPVLGDPAMVVLVPTVHVGRSPRHPVVRDIDVLVERVVNLPPNVEGTVTTF